MVRLGNCKMKNLRRFVITIAPWPISVRQSLCNLQMRRAFIADFPTEKFGYHSSYTPTDGGLGYLIIAVEEISRRGPLFPYPSPPKKKKTITAHSLPLSVFLLPM
jgi:hypothetical protein